MLNMTHLSVNINKIATLRNARGGNNPNVLKVAQDCERFGAQGITVHPRPDERHIRYSDVTALSKIVTTEFNVEGYPDQRYLQLIQETKPTQATLVPDAPGVLTSNQGWDTMAHGDHLKILIRQIKKSGCRVSLFVDAEPLMVEGAAQAGADRIELYTGPYAEAFHKNKEEAIEPYLRAAERARTLGMGVNAGHDLDLHNLRYLKTTIPWMDEVSIGHALFCDAIYFGLENVVQMYLKLIAR
jgi:pyridoxine 5-phosphate synthase